VGGSAFIANKLGRLQGKEGFLLLLLLLQYLNTFANLAGAVNGTFEVIRPQLFGKAELVVDWELRTKELYIN
jgi:hypothetical protein